MATFSQLAKGKRARKGISFPLLAPQAAEGEGARERELQVDVIVLSGLEDAEVMAKARAFAKERGVDDPKDGNPIYDLALWAFTLAVACVDPESPETEPRPFFDGGADQIMGSNLLGRDTIAYLYEHQQQWQDEVSPRARTIGAEALLAHVVAVAASEDPTPFFRLAPALRWTLHRSMAALLVTLQTPRSPSGSGSEDDGASSKPSGASDEKSEAAADR
jgi:hypothetical protein